MPQPRRLTQPLGRNRLRHWISIWQVIRSSHWNKNTEKIRCQYVTKRRKESEYYPTVRPDDSNYVDRSGAFPSLGPISWHTIAEPVQEPLFSALLLAIVLMEFWDVDNTCVNRIALGALWLCVARLLESHIIPTIAELLHARLDMTFCQGRAIKQRA